MQDEAEVAARMGQLRHGARRKGVHVSINVAGDFNLSLEGRATASPELHAAVRQLHELDPEQLKAVALYAAAIKGKG